MTGPESAVLLRQIGWHRSRTDYEAIADTSRTDQAFTDFPTTM
ncbi:hypothetical protein [Specibacter sp. NPDC078709]